MVIYNTAFLLSSCRWSPVAGGDSAGGRPALSIGRLRVPVGPVAYSADPHIRADCEGPQINPE